MPRRNRTARIAAAVLGAVTIVIVVSACDRPTPKVTFQSGSTSTQAHPQTYCFDLAHCRISTSSHLASLTTKPGSTIVVDVPREVANHTWQVNAATLAGQKFTALPVDGASSSAISDGHSTRVLVPYATGEYYLIVRSSKSNKDSGSWLAKINVTN